MSTTSAPLHLPQYYEFMDSIAILALPLSGSQLHGLMCGYLCAGANSEGAQYLRALITNTQDVAVIRGAVLALFGVYAVSQQQIGHFDFEFQLLLPNDEAPLPERAQAFSEWCEGFIEGLTMAGIGDSELQEEESQEALQHLVEFSQLDYHELKINEEDERALMEVSEYARLAVLRIHADLLSSHLKDGQSETAH